jgi:phosphoenolpyruvate carboxykinase (ATP)
MPIRVTRKLLAAALDGSLAKAHFRADPIFGLAIPDFVPGIEPQVLDPARTWASQEDYGATAMKLVNMFRENFAKFEPYVDRKIIEAQPAGVIAAEWKRKGAAAG